jgi:hypothetical protein
MKLRVGLFLIGVLGLANVNLGGTFALQGQAQSLDQAIRIIQKGIGSRGVTDRQAWDASLAVLEAAERDPEIVRPWKQVLIEEVSRIDSWDHFRTELAGSYHENLVKALFPLADADLVPLFIRKCKYGSFVKAGLAKVGRPAIAPLIGELLDGRYTTCAAMSLATIAGEGLGAHSTLSPEEKTLLRRDLMELAVPALERALERARAEEGADPGPGRRRFSAARIAESLKEVREILSKQVGGGRGLSESLRVETLDKT